MHYCFESFTLDTDRFELCADGEPLHIEPQVIELLVLLLEQRERMVSKQEILDKIWHGRVVSEAALSSRIKSLRQALGDDGRSQKFIRTIHKKGFRFVAKVEAESAPAPQTVAAPPATDALVAQRRPAIAVLPFSNLSSDQQQEYFSDGITADIIGHLSKHRWLDIIARNTTFGLKGESRDVREIGQLLDADYVVTGSVQLAGKRVRISCNLIETATGHQKWADRYDREIADIFDLQDEITEKVVARLEPEIGFAERNKVFHSRPANLQAWDCYHLGVYHFFRFTGPDNLEAQRLLKQSQQLDENFGEAYAWWAYALILGMVYWDTPPSAELLDEALAACNKALSLDSQNAIFYALQARVLLARREYSSAIAQNEIAISLNPTLAAGFCGLGDSLAYEGRYEESIACFDKAVELSPNDPQLWAFLTYGALALLFKGEYATALQWADRAANIPNHQYWTTAHQVVALSYLDQPRQAQEMASRLVDENPAFSLEFAREKLFYLKQAEQIELYLDGLEKAGVPKS